MIPTNNEPWTAKAFCRGDDPEVWFAEAARFAKRVCNGDGDVPPCPVRTECLAYGMSESDGVWGGLDPRERKQLARKMAQTA